MLSHREEAPTQRTKYDQQTQKDTAAVPVLLFLPKDLQQSRLQRLYQLGYRFKMHPKDRRCGGGEAR
ncbi:MAG: hypothetical protein ACFCU8_19230 [Thermosynechococcaceae cyanobacterium]